MRLVFYYFICNVNNNILLTIKADYKITEERNTLDLRVSTNSRY